MELNKWQEKVDNWIKTYGIRYFDIKTNTLLLTEEVGELARLIARQYGEQSFKNETSATEASSMIADELGDTLFVLTCIANQLDINLDEVLAENIKKKTNRDAERHHKNDKLLK